MPSVVIQSSEDLNLLDRCMETLDCPLSALSAHQFAQIGNEIEQQVEEGFLRGHGTTLFDGRLRASVCGVIERVDKLVSVRAIRSRYSPELGDVVVGRVIEVAGTRWNLDLRARREAVIALSAVNLPGDEQRRRTAEDALAMRDLYREGDLLSAEVQAIYADGTVFLHTRSTKYGKLEGGHVRHCAVLPHQAAEASFQQVGVPWGGFDSGLQWLDMDLPEPREATSGG
eukprot:jgi/Botrbrau1/1820/Bobra.146_1s0018.1